LRDQRVDVAPAHRREEGGAGVEADEFFLPRQSGLPQREQHALRAGLVRTEDAVGLAQLVDEVHGGVLRRRRGDAAVAVVDDDLDARVFADGGEKALLALRGACRALGAAKQHDLALAAHQPRELRAAHAAAAVIVGRDIAGEVLAHLALQRGVEDHDRDVARHGGTDGSAEGGVVERREHDGIDARADELLHDADLLGAIVLLERTLPEDFHVEFLPRLPRPGLDRLPEIMGRALGDDRDLFVGGVRAGGGEQGEGECDEAG
jgi:hypothetical protein